MNNERKTSNAAAAQMMNFDEFMSYEGAKGGGGGYLGGWKKNGEGPKDGQVTVYLHRTKWAAAAWVINWPRLVEFTDKKTDTKEMRVWSGRWISHEREIVNKKQHFRDKVTGEREYPPEVCPFSLLVDYLYRMYRTGKLALTQPIFHFEGDRPDETITLTLGGIVGRYGSKDLTPVEERAIKAARIRRDEAYKEDLRPKLKYLYLVCDEKAPEEGIQKTWEGQGLTNKIKKAIGDEGKKLAKKGKAHLANPAEHPFPLEWTYDDGQDFDDKFDVLALVKDEGEKVLDEIMKVISGEAPDTTHDLAKGDCFALRGEMEAHLVKGVVLDWDAIFGPAKEAGLMAPPPESKADEDGEEEPADMTGEAVQVIQIGADHACWSTPGWAPGSDIRAGVEVHVLAPDGTDGDALDRVLELCRKAGAMVAEVVACTHCGKAMTTLDSACGHCGATYADNGDLASRPCLVDGCGGQCELPAGGEGNAVCAKCGQVHTASKGSASGAGVWTMVVPEKPKAEPAKSTSTRRRPAPVGAAAKGDPIPFGG